MEVRRKMIMNNISLKIKKKLLKFFKFRNKKEKERGRKEVVPKEGYIIPHAIF
ncbi:unnamed protein product [Meloidogyne enterolobii]|uniref:Uncharacterized protein n=1 Tax=Meloidogyne enterolobii TaxID=390850 RepID=A0ACB1AYZ3_MELEN